MAGRENESNKLNLKKKDKQRQTGYKLSAGRLDGLLL